MAMEEDKENPRDLPKATYEELDVNEQLLDSIDNRLVSIQHHLSRPIYQQRDAIYKKIPNFWALVLEDAPPEIDQYIQPSDSLIFAQCLQDLQVERFEIPAKLPTDPYAPLDPTEDPTKKWGEPRSIKVTFTFDENEFFQDKVLEKKFYFRRSKDGWTGLVSEPVPINWKPGKDLTGGLLDAAVKLVAAEKKAKAAAGGQKYGRSGLPESQKIKALLEKSGGDMSFFAFFGYRGRNVSAEESAAAHKERYEEVAKIVRGESTEDDDDDDDEDMEDVMDEFETEIFPDGEDVALAIAEDLWPGATRYFTGADANFSDVDFEEDEDDEDEDEDEEMGDGDDDDDEEDEKVPDIRGLVNAQKRAASATAARKPKRR